MRKILRNYPLSKITFIHTGGRAQFLDFPKSIYDVKHDLEFAKSNNLNVTVIGNASNLIISDKGLDGLVIVLTKFDNTFIQYDLVIADAGALMIDISNQVQQYGLSGMEYCAGLPGTVGGAVFMNASAYNGSTGNIVKSITVISRKTGKVREISSKSAHFRYRYSMFQNNNDWIILRVTFKLKFGHRNKIKALMDNFNAQRSTKQPLDYPSCGSVFRRPKGYYVGQLIHNAGLQGYRSGGAMVSNIHAGFIVNVNHATASDYLNVIHHIQEIVYDKYRVKLRPEVRILKR